MYVYIAGKGLTPGIPEYVGHYQVDRRLKPLENISFDTHTTSKPSSKDPTWTYR